MMFQSMHQVTIMPIVQTMRINPPKITPPLDVIVPTLNCSLFDLDFDAFRKYILSDINRIPFNNGNDIDAYNGSSSNSEDIFDLNTVNHSYNFTNGTSFTIGSITPSFTIGSITPSLTTSPPELSPTIHQQVNTSEARIPPRKPYTRRAPRNNKFILYCTKCGLDKHPIKKCEFDKECDDKFCGHCGKSGHHVNACSLINRRKQRPCGRCGMFGHYKKTCMHEQIFASWTN